LPPLVKGDSPVRGNVRNADKGGAVSGEEDVTAYAVTGGFHLKNPSVALKITLVPFVTGGFRRILRAAWHTGNTVGRGLRLSPQDHALRDGRPVPYGHRRK